jgi:hypothetical protein
VFWTPLRMHMSWTPLWNGQGTPAPDQMSGHGHQEWLLALAVPASMEVGGGHDHNSVQVTNCSSLEHQSSASRRKDHSLSLSAHINPRIINTLEHAAGTAEARDVGKLRLAAGSQRVFCESVIQRHTETTTVLHLLTELYQGPGNVSAWSYSVQQCAWLCERLEPVVGEKRMGGSRSWPLRGMDVGLRTAQIRRLSCSSRCMVGKQLEPSGRLSRTTLQDRGGAGSGSGKSHPVGGARQSVTCGAAPVGVSIFAAAVLVGAGTPARRPGQAQRTRQPVPAHDGAHITMAIDAWRWRLGSLPLEQRSLLEGTYVI